MIAIILTALIFIIAMILSFEIEIKRYICKHDKGVHETQACDAICKSCGKNLGFIGTEENKIRRMQ